MNLIIKHLKKWLLGFFRHSLMAEMKRQTSTSTEKKRIARGVKAFFDRHYELRYNIIKQQEEFRPLCHDEADQINSDADGGNSNGQNFAAEHQNSCGKHQSATWQQLTDRELSRIAFEQMLEVGVAWSVDVELYVRSALTPDYNPIADYLSRCGTWDGTTDYIRQFARRVPTDYAAWPDLFHRWFLGMVAQWQQRSRDYGNAVVPMLIGGQGTHKSTFCKRLSIQLLACGLRPLSFSTDDYFVNRVDTPKLPNGDYDFDNIETVEYALLEDHLLRLMQGERVEIPEYNFVTGKREYNGKKLKLGSDTVLIIEGIHALNPLLTKKIPDATKYKIFISALTSISLDDHNWIPTRDNRLLRRIIRDYNKGAYTAQQTIAQWKNVLVSEDQWITPFQETADVMFNSALNIEFAVLRIHAEIILTSVPKNCPEYAEAHRLLKFLHYFLPISDKEIPPTSIMREFLGGSSFKY